MRPISSDQSRSDLTLNEVFGTRGQVRLLRILTTETDGSIASPEVAKRAGMTPSGARKALRRLARAGVVEKVGRGKATRYVLNREGRLAPEIARLFQLERKAADPSWRPDSQMGSVDSPEDSSDLGHGAGKPDGNGARHGNGNGNGNRNGPGAGSQNGLRASG